ncbi:hypothetical protein BSR28_02235 [Boudabousia liubingyangii]|uniref:PP2C family protein-serine/threonine phosphatase n=1 Tax=Boudabousia liubingyangii TaxID=1921764 RepID=UPI00093A592F|nr:PP2C family serine/threonine-protein phosphatase [Boudabousia liubingyangii]OKL48528.1 hypothetical protein BSR28_02235 [Boudabousia liubingyangii]
MPVEIRYAARSDVGLMRKNNQDSGYAGQHLLVLADGMGGPAGGDIASSIAVAHLAPLDSDAVPGDQLLPVLTEALESAHAELISRSEADPDLAGLGTTCIAMLRSGNKIAMLHIGDSRAYLLRENKLIQVTKDHSFVQYLVDTGQLDPEAAASHPQKNVVLRVLGDQDEVLYPDESLREAVPGDRWLLCSDGLSGVVSEDTIAQVLTEEKDLNECADLLIQLALKGGGPDNVTVVLADVQESSSEDQQTTPQVVGAAATDRLAQSRAASSSAAKAAALGGKGLKDGVDPAADEDELSEARSERRSALRKRLAWTLGSLLFVLAIAGGLFAGYRWTQTQYYAIAEGNQIVVYQGIPQKLGFIELSRPLEVKPYKLSDLSPAVRNRLEEPVTRGSRQELDHYLDSLVNEDGWRNPSQGSFDTKVILPGQKTPSPTPAPTPGKQPAPSKQLAPKPTPAPKPAPKPAPSPAPRPESAPKPSAAPAQSSGGDHLWQQ